MYFTEVFEVLKDGVEEVCDSIKILFIEEHNTWFVNTYLRRLEEEKKLWEK